MAKCKTTKMMDGDDDMSMSKGKKKDCSMSSGKSHPGFKAVESKIAKKEGISDKRAGAILANSSREAGKSAKKANPALKKVK